MHDCQRTERESQATGRRCLILMMKAPTPGRVKTRLAKTIGPEAAARLYRAFVERLARELLAAPGRSWTPAVAFDPPEAEAALQAWLRPILPPEVAFWPQGPGDLGDRLRGAFERAFAAGARAVLALGADCLEITPEELQAGFGALEKFPVLLGPAEDGGYWTLGLAGPYYDLLRDMPWSSPDLAESTRRRARQLDLPLAELPPKRDVDEAEDLERLPEALKRLIGLRPSD